MSRWRVAWPIGCRARPRLVDLGGGTGSLFRFLAPIIGRGQDWILVDADDALLEEAFGRTAAWARRQGFAATAEGDELSVSTPHGLWRMRGGACAIFRAVHRHGRAWPGHPRLLARRMASQTWMAGPSPAMTTVRMRCVCSALLDLVSAAWLARLCDTLTVPFLACLTADGRDTWQPRHPHDALVRTAFRRDMRRDKGFGPALGTAAPTVLTRARLRDRIGAE